MKKMSIFQLAVFLFSVLLAANSCFAASTYTFAWSPNPEPVEGYWLYWRIPPATTYSKTASTSIDTGKPSTVDGTVTYVLDASSFIVGENYCFALTAYEGEEESAYTTGDVCLDTPPGEGNTNINLMSRELTEETAE